MVSVDYFGRVGNNLYQYVMARLIAQANSMRLMTEWCHNNFIVAKPDDGDLSKEKYEDIAPIEIGDTSVSPLLRRDYTGKNVHLHGYFQDAVFYNPYRELIKNFFVLPQRKLNTEDIVIHLRLTDYWWHRNNSCVISPVWYHNILRKQKYRKLYIVVEPHVTNRHYLNSFKQFRPEIISGTPKSDFEFLMSFDRIVCSNSTFAWWAAFLSEASKIWIFKKWMGFGRACNRLANMTGAIILDGEFIRDKRLMNIDWTDYWKKPDIFFEG